MTKKGHIVALETRQRTSFVPGSGVPSRETRCWTLVRVTKAKRDGTVVAVQKAGPGAPQQLCHMPYSPRIHTIPDDKQPAAERAFAKIEWLAPEWESDEALRAAILAA